MAKKSIPENVLSLLSAADQRAGLPAGTMYAIMQQEVGGQFDKFLTDPGAAHYTPDAQGKKKSSAFGPFGILESTAAKPGFGVAPLKDRSLGEQVRFAADYLGARVRHAGSLEAGIGGYGEGSGYAKSVMARMSGVPVATPAQTSTAVAAAPVTAAPVTVVKAEPAPFMTGPEQVALSRVAMDSGAQGPDAWQSFLNTYRGNAVTPTDMQYGPATAAAAAPVVPSLQVPDFMAALGQLGRRPEVNFQPFQAMKQWV